MKRANEVVVEPVTITQKKKERKAPGKKTIVIGAIILVIIIAAAALFFVFGRGAAASTETQIMEATVSTSDVSTTIEGTGSLANSGSENISIASGVEIREVQVAVGDKVSQGDILATVEEYSLKAALYSASESLTSLDEQIASADSSTSEYYSLLKQRDDTQEAYDALAKIAETNTIIAPSDGVITSVGIYENTSAGSSDPNSDVSSSSDNSSSNGMNGLVSYESTGSNNSQPVTAGYTTSSGSILSSESVQRVSDTDTVTISSLDLSKAKLTPVIGGSPVTTLTGSSYSGTVSWNPPPGATFAMGISYTATIELQAADGYAFSPTLSITIPDASEVSYVLDGSTLTITAVYSLLLKQDTDTNSSTNTNNNSTNGNASSSTSNPSSTSGGSTGSAETTGTGGSADTTGAGDDSTSSTQLITAFGIAGGSSMSITASIDEMDINSVSIGQSVRVTISALDEGVFDGEITKVNKTGTSSNGVTKYSVEISLPRTEEMLEGMNASVSIIIQESIDALSIPSVALQTEGTRTFVYTQYDENTGELSGEVDVEIGNSDGARVEILSGLSEGDTVYYLLTISGDSAESGTFGGMGGMGGDMPEFSREDMPDMENMSGSAPNTSNMSGGTRQ